MKKGVSLVLLVAVVIFGSVCVLAVAGVNHTWSELQKCGADQFAKMNPAGTEWECAIATTSSGGEVVGGFWDKVPSPSDDIYYNDGGVGIGVADDIGYLGLKVQGNGLCYRLSNG